VGASPGAGPIGPNAAAGADDPPPRGKHIAFLYSSNVRGEYAPCACPSQPLGGLTRRATLVDRARIEADGILHVDVGDLTPPPPPVPDGMLPPDPKEVERRTRLLLEAYARMGVDAWTPGETDLRLGPRRLAALAAAAKLPTVLGNVVDRHGKPLFPPTRVVFAAELKIGLFGVFEPGPDGPPWGPKEGLQVTDAGAAARAAVEALRAQGVRLVVGLFHLEGGLARARALVREVPGIDFVALGHGGENLEVPEREGQTTLLEAFELGRLLGRLDLHVVDDRLDFVDRGRRAQLETMRKSYEEQVADLRGRLAADRSGQGADTLRQRIERLEARLAETGGALAEAPPRPTGSWYENRLLEIAEPVPEHSGVYLQVRLYDDESAARAERGLPVGIAPRAPAGPPRRSPPPATPGPRAHENWDYGSNGSCVLCHKDAYEHWKTTKHAQALETLRRRKRDKDPTCLGCHTTGYLQPGGTRVLATATTYFADVGCESCHGPSVAHVRAIDKKTGTRLKVPEEVCLGCHTPDQTAGDFEYSAYVEAILGPGHGRPPPGAP
jgi:hypothetical protein